eukprot:5481630-Heterocapsa_arctica.AAC.1
MVMARGLPDGPAPSKMMMFDSDVDFRFRCRCSISISLSISRSPGRPVGAEVLPDAGGVALAR